MKKKISKWFSVLLPLSIGFFFIFYSYQKFTPNQIEEIKDQFKNANYKYIYLSLTIGFLSHLSRAYRWRYTLEYLGYRSKIHNNFMAVWIGYLVNMTIPRSGEFFRALVLNKYEKIPIDKSFGTIISERVVDLIFLMFFVVIALSLQFDKLIFFLPDYIPIKKLVHLTLFITLIGISLILFFLYSKWRFIMLIKNKISGLIEGLLSIVRMKKKWSFIFHTLFIWICYILMFYVSIFVLSETKNINFETIITSFVVGSLAISFTNGGFGAYPFLIGEILSLYSIPGTAGVAFGWIVWTSQIIMLIVCGSLSFLFLPIFNKKE